MKNKRKTQELQLLESQRILRENKRELSKEKRLSATDKNSVIDMIFKKEPKRYTVEDTIPYLRMLKSGICQLDKTHFNKCISFQDINYQLALEEDKDLIFNQFANVLNSFDPTVTIEFSYVNQIGRNTELKAAIQIPDKNDGYDDIRLEFRDMLKNQLAKGNNGLKKSKYITFGIEATNVEQARTKLERIEIDLLSNLKSMGVRAESLTGIERLKVLHDILNPDKFFSFSYKGLKPRESTKSVIAPDSFNFIPSRYFKFGTHIGAVSHIQILASELSDRMLAEFLDIDDNINISFHIKAIEQTEAIKMVKRKNTDIDRMKIEENKKAVRSGYDMDILPSDLITYGDNIKMLLKDLQTRDERMFVVTIIFMNFAKSLQKLDATLSQISSIASKHNCKIKRLDHSQEQGFISVLPLGVNKIEINRCLTSSSAVFLPFTTEELFINSENSLYYGLNALSHNLIMADRKMLKNPNGLILGTPGSGKSFSAKREMANAILTTDDDIIICDPEGEYGNLVKQFKGEVIKVSAKSQDYLNPLDINMNYGDGDAPLKDKANFIMSMLELVVGGSGLTAEEKSVIDRCLPKIYEEYFSNPIPENMPILQDLYDMLKGQEEKVGKKLATEMEIYVSGSLNVFNHQSNIDLNKQLLCFDIKELGTQLKKIGMLVIQDQVWNKVSQNRNSGKSTRYYIDEFHLLLKDEQTSQYSVEIWKRFRKWGGIPTGITQNVKDLLASKEIENIFDNTDFILMLNQATGDREYLVSKLKISKDQEKFVTNSKAGEGLVFFGNTIVPFVDNFPKDTILYQKMTTKPEEMRM